MVRLTPLQLMETLMDMVLRRSGSRRMRFVRLMVVSKEVLG